MGAITRLTERIDKLEEEVVELREQLAAVSPTKHAAKSTRVGGGRKTAKG